MLYYAQPERGRRTELATNVQEPAEPSDAELMRALGSGSMSALGGLVARHQHRLRSLAYRISGRWDVADDIVQETFLRLHRAAPRYRPDASLSTWLYRVVVNLCLDRAKRRKWAWSNEAAEAAPATDDLLVRDEAIAAVRREVQALPERQRIALVLHRFDGLTHGEIAKTTGWSESAVESLLVRAYSQLRERLQKWSEP